MTFPSPPRKTKDSVCVDGQQSVKPNRETVVLKAGFEFRWKTMG